MSQPGTRNLLQPSFKTGSNETLEGKDHIHELENPITTPRAHQGKGQAHAAAPAWEKRTSKVSNMMKVRRVNLKRNQPCLATGSQYSSKHKHSDLDHSFNSKRVYQEPYVGFEIGTHLA